MRKILVYITLTILVIFSGVNKIEADINIPDISGTKWDGVCVYSRVLTDAGGGDDSFEAYVYYNDTEIDVELITDTDFSFSNDITFDDWNKAMITSSGEKMCPYKIYLTKFARESSYVVKTHKTNFFFGLITVATDYTMACENCDVSFESKIDFTELYTCDDLIQGRFKELLYGALDIIKIVVPIIIIVLGLLDFGRAVLASSEDDMKKAQNKFIKRLLIGVIIFLSPVFVNLIVNIVNDTNDLVNYEICNIE